MTTSSIFKALKAEKDNAQQSDVVPMSVDGSDAGTADVEMESKESIERIGSLTEKPSQDEMVVAEEEEEDDGDDGEAFVVGQSTDNEPWIIEIIIFQFQLGERNAVVFSLASAKAKMPSLRDLPDSFFDLNVRDIKILMRELRTQIKGTTDQPLLTAQLRELEEDKERLTKLNRYKKSIIRIEFPDRHVLQGTFTPMETIETVMNFVRLYLTSPEVDFYLCKQMSNAKKANEFNINHSSFLLQTRRHQKWFSRKKNDCSRLSACHRQFYISVLAQRRNRSSKQMFSRRFRQLKLAWR